MSTPLARQGAESGVVTWTASWELTSGGAVVAAPRPRGIAVSRSGAGTYAVRLPADARGTFRGARVTLTCADGAASTRRAVATTYDAATRVLTVVTQSTAGTAADLSAGFVTADVLLGAVP